MKKSNMLIVAITLAVLGCYAFNNFWLSSQSKHWPSIQGVVTTSSVYRTSGRFSATYPEIHYQFQVNSKNYTGDKLDFGGDRSYVGDPHQFVTQYPAGKAITIYYDSDNPEDSVLFPENNAPTFNLIFAVTCWIFSLGLFRNL